LRDFPAHSKYHRGDPSLAAFSILGTRTLAAMVAKNNFRASRKETENYQTKRQGHEAPENN
jgi:hypothetical protein